MNPLGDPTLPAKQRYGMPFRSGLLKLQVGLNLFQMISAIFFFAGPTIDKYQWRDALGFDVHVIFFRVHFGVSCVALVNYLVLAYRRRWLAAPWWFILGSLAVTLTDWLFYAWMVLLLVEDSVVWG